MGENSSVGSAETAAVAATAASLTDPRSGGRHEGAATDNSPEIDLKYRFRFDCLDNAHYHGMRAALFDRVHRILMGMVLISSSGAAGAFAGIEILKPIVPYGALFPVLFSTLDLVIAPGSNAQTHAALRSRYLELLAEIEEEEDSKANRKRWVGALHRTYSQEPAVTYRAQKAVSYNAAIDALNEEDIAAKKRLVIPFHQRWFGWIFQFHSASYVPRSQHKSLFVRFCDYFKRRS